ncbi:site-specific tyrosine recombinase XerC [Mycobacteroides abscessus subsp. bolletii]|uniref:integrase n=1 Tax=Mycobacteroides abscessus TaxID=36809 RepID=UPI0009D07506|nr:integrase [Mycobacteroides abscessus]SKG85708.1 site-specific tyrosine recombinase XerC [Mycobacteroides abscessus subsp. bolletii]SKH44673.1 site-specific tyrosine recombinase XerC [Mycobacteroides abscessus subsp. bolletii]
MSTLPAAASGRKTSISELPALTLSLPLVTDSLSEVVAMVVARWNHAANAGTLSVQTANKFGQLAVRFQGFSAAHGIVTVSGVDGDLVSRFVTAQGRTRYGAVSRAAVATMHNRRSAIRALFRTARELGLAIDDPTAAIYLPDRMDSTRRPITDSEAGLIRLASEREHSSRHASTAALLLAGAHTGEIGHVTTADLDYAACTAHIHGSSKYRSRTVPLNAWALRMLRARANHLAGPLPTDQPPLVLCTGAAGSDAHKQARVCVTVREILTRAGLSDDNTIRPTSLTAHAAYNEYLRTGRIEAAAILIGSPSLDATAALIGYCWQTR